MNPQKELIVITGGSRGIGKAIVSLIGAQAKYDTVIVSREEEVAAKAGAAFYFRADLSVKEQIETTAFGIAALDRPVKAVINNAGSMYDDRSLGSVSYDTLIKSMNLHCFAPLLFTNILVPQLKKSSGGSVVNIGSIYGSIADHTVPAYVLSKSPIPLLTSMMARAYAPDIRVNSILPGHVDTEMTGDAPSGFISDIISKTPLKRLATTDEIAKLALFMIGDDSSFITGSSVRIDGGFWSILNS